MATEVLTALAAEVLTVTVFNDTVTAFTVIVFLCVCGLFGAVDPSIRRVVRQNLFLVSYATLASAASSQKWLCTIT